MPLIVSSRGASGAEPVRVKVHFCLGRDETGYPPVDSETVWAIAKGENLFRVDNIPFFVTGVSCFDIVSVRREGDGQLWYDQLLEASGHTTIHVILYRDSSDERPLEERVESLRKAVKEIGGSSELSHISNLIAVDLPPEIPLRPLKELLEKGQESGFWDYREATLAHAV
jgi:hypothetical protein